MFSFPFPFPGNLIWQRYSLSSRYNYFYHWKWSFPLWINKLASLDSFNQSPESDIQKQLSVCRKLRDRSQPLAEPTKVLSPWGAAHMAGTLLFAAKFSVRHDTSLLKNFLLNTLWISLHLFFILSVNISLCISLRTHFNATKPSLYIK
jgi:hypothetical protein